MVTRIMSLGHLRTAAFLALALIQVVSISADEGNTVSPVAYREQLAEFQSTTDARFAQLEAELASLRSPLGEGPDYAAPACGCANECGCANDYCCANDCCCANPSCCTCCPSSGWIAGAGFYHIKPHWGNNPAFAIGTTAGGSSTQTDFNYSLAVAPVVYLGYVGGNGLGFRTRYWSFDQTDTINLPALGGGQVYQTAAPLGLGGTGNVNSIFQSGLETHVLDFEVIKLLWGPCWTATIGAGVRYVKLNQSYRGTVAANGLVFVQTAHDFEGIGPELSAEYRYNLGESRWSVYGLGRAAVLCGSSDQTASSFFAVGDRPVRSASHSSVLPISELELGVTYTQAFRFGCLRLNAGLVGQAWFGAGNSSNNELIVFTAPAAGARGFQETADNGSNLGFLGWTMDISLTY